MGSQATRFYSASPEEVFEAALRAPASLGYDLLHVDAARRTLSFVTTKTDSDRREVTVSVDGGALRSHVVVTESDPVIALASGGRLTWAVNVPNQFMKAVTEILLRPPPGWLTDPSGRFVQRWWDGSGWTGRARDSERGPQYLDQPGDLAPPVPIDRTQQVHA